MKKGTQTKQTLAILLVATFALVLTACGQPSEGQSRMDDLTAAFASGIDGAEVPVGVEPQPIQTYPSAGEAFAAVLTKEGSVYFPWTGESMTLEGYLYEHSTKATSIGELVYDFQLSTIESVDFDSDGIPEVVLGVKEASLVDVYYYLVLHYNKHDGVVSAYIVYPRGFADFRENGMFYSRSGPEYSYARLVFPEDSQAQMSDPMEIIYRLVTEDYENQIFNEETGISLPSHYVNGMPVSDNDYRAIKFQHDSSPKVITHEYTEENIVSVLALY